MKVIDQTLLEKVIIEHVLVTVIREITVACSCWEGPILMGELSSCQPLQLSKVVQDW